MPLPKDWCDPGASIGDMSISVLNISANNIGDQGAAAIAEMLRTNTVGRFPDPHCRISPVSLSSSVADLVHRSVSVLPVCIRVTAGSSTNIWLQQHPRDHCVRAAYKRQLCDSSSDASSCSHRRSNPWICRPTLSTMMASPPLPALSPRTPPCVRCTSGVFLLAPPPQLPDLRGVILFPSFRITAAFVQRSALTLVHPAWASHHPHRDSIP